MISTAKTRFILAATCLVAASLAYPAMAKTTATTHGISKTTFVSNCSDMGGEVIDGGGDHAGCDLPSGTSVVCSFEPADSDVQVGVCEVTTRLARTDFRHLLETQGMSLNVGQVPESLTSTGSESAPGAVGGVAGGKGAYAGGADAGPSSMGDGGPAIK